jgi:hypothetical protein
MSRANGWPSDVGVTFGALLPGQPLGIGRGFIRAEFHTTGQRLGEYERGGGLERAGQQIGGARRLEAKGPPILDGRVDLGEVHVAPSLVNQARGVCDDSPVGQPESADAPPLSYRPLASLVTIVMANRAGRKRPHLP